MIFSSHSPSVPLFHSLESGTVEQTFNQRNSSWNMGETRSLKGLAHKVLERNRDWNIYGTKALNSVPPPHQPVPVSGTRFETDCSSQNDALSYAFEERAAIAEYDGHQTPLQAERIAYLDAFVILLLDLTALDPQRGWLAQKVQIARTTLETQNILLNTNHQETGTFNAEPQRLD